MEGVAPFGGDHRDACRRGHLHDGGDAVGQDTVPGFGLFAERAGDRDGLQLAAHADGQGLDGALTAVGQRAHLHCRVPVYAQDAFPDGVARLQRAEASLERVDGNGHFHAAVSFRFHFRFP